jgi:hypothetical protein
MTVRLLLAAVAFWLGAALPAAALNNSFPTNGDTQMCSGRPWIDVLCNGADPSGAADSTNAIQTTINSAIANNWPLHIPAGTYKITSLLTIDYAGQASKGFRLISEGATLNGTTIAAGPVLQIKCSGGTPASPTGCFYFHEEGSLFVNATTPAYAVVIGTGDFSDAHNSIKIDHLLVNNSSSNAAAGGCQFNYVLDSDLYAVCVSNGGAAGMAFEQLQFSRVSGAGTAQGTGGRGVLLENGYNFSNTFFALDLEVSPICLSITFAHNGLNTFVSPFFNCVTAVNATASLGNTIINPNYGGAVVNYGPVSVGLTVMGTGSRNNWLFPTSGTYAAAPVDDGLSISSYNAPGASMTITLPAVANINPGWQMAFATDNGKGMTINATSGSIVSGGKAVSSLVLGSGNYEYVRLQSDGNNFRVLSSTKNTRLANGMETTAPSNWLYPASSGYSATLADDGNIVSSYNTASGLTVTLPPTTAVPNGWTMGFATDNGKSLTVQVNGTNGGHIAYPGSGGSTASIAMPVTTQGAYEFLVLQYDNSGANSNFRVISATPATKQAIGMLGVSGITRWSFPAVSAYAATAADNGNAISSYNTPLSFMTVTLPAVSAINPGWTIGVARENGKTQSVQVNGSAAEKILIPGSQGAVNSLTLAQNYELAILQFDGSNFRIVSMTPTTASYVGAFPFNGTPASSSAACTTNFLSFDSNYLYICTNTNTWKRAPLSSF